MKSFNIFVLSKYSLAVTLILGLVFILPRGGTEASVVDELKNKIEDRNSRIEQIEAEIKKYQQELSKTSQESRTLQNAIRTLDLSRRKYLQEISLTQARIQNTSLEIEEIIKEIADKEKKMQENSLAAAQALRKINELHAESLLSAMLRHDKLSDYWDSLANLERLQKSLHLSIENLSDLKLSLEEARVRAENGKQSLISQNANLADQKKIVEYNQTEKNELLSITKNKEAEYQRLIREKEANKKQFEQEIFLFESQIKIHIDPASVPPAGKGVLSWPLDSVFVTQQFGRTSASGRLYASGTHNGVDFRASVGTPVKSVLAGVVEAVGDTDTACKNASYGKWILVKHVNGLTSLYAHLSLISVSPGQTVTTGQKIGHSGNTGYSTGPHLHLSLFASQGVKVSSLPSNACRGAIYTLPLADPKAYLDPLEYL
jgi:murein DD-endopeptidase MepM/ murein hydrolase activator NlpD